MFRTPDAMLSSVQDYRAGLPGLQEHIWGATLGSEIQVFATHPADATSAPPRGRTRGPDSAVLPRVHQDRDTLLVVHRIPDDDWIGTTHLWFPVEQCDEWQRSWQLAGRPVGRTATSRSPPPAGCDRSSPATRRCSAGGQSGTVPVTSPPSAAPTTDGSFDDFVAALAEPEFGGTPAEPSVRWTARDGRVLDLGWVGAFTVDGTVPGTSPDGSVDDPLHLDNPATKQAFGAETLKVEWMGERLVLDYRCGRRLHPSGIGAPPNGADNT